MKATPKLEEGLYQMFLDGQCEVVEIQYLTRPWPRNKACLLAHFLSGFPRFPRPIRELLSYGATFKKIK